jgi:hypothetical protein
MTDTENKIKELIPATEEMWDMLDENNKRFYESDKEIKELRRLEDGLADAVIAFGQAVKVAQQKIDRSKKIIADCQEKNKDYYKDFQRKFKVQTHEISWLRRK